MSHESNSIYLGYWPTIHSVYVLWRVVGTNMRHLDHKSDQNISYFWNLIQFLGPPDVTPYYVNIFHTCFFPLSNSCLSDGVTFS